MVTELMFFELLMPAMDFILDQAGPKLFAAILLSRIVLFLALRILIFKSFVAVYNSEAVPCLKARFLACMQALTDSVTHGLLLEYMFTLLHGMDMSLQNAT